MHILQSREKFERRCPSEHLEILTSQQNCQLLGNPNIARLYGSQMQSPVSYPAPHRGQHHPHKPANTDLKVKHTAIQICTDNQSRSFQSPASLLARLGGHTGAKLGVSGLEACAKVFLMLQTPNSKQSLHSRHRRAKDGGNKGSPRTQKQTAS